MSNRSGRPSLGDLIKFDFEENVVRDSDNVDLDCGLNYIDQLVSLYTVKGNEIKESDLRITALDSCHTELDSGETGAFVSCDEILKSNPNWREDNHSRIAVECEFIQENLRLRSINNSAIGIIKELLDVCAQLKQRLYLTLLKSVQERSEVNTAFEELHTRYSNSIAMLKVYKNNEVLMENRNNALLQDLSMQKLKYEVLCKHAQSKLDEANGISDSNAKETVTKNSKKP